jgi:hypothetical protein
MQSRLPNIFIDGGDDTNTMYAANLLAEDMVDSFPEKIVANLKASLEALQVRTSRQESGRIQGK